MDFNTAFDLLLTHEGGFSNRSLSDDPGGVTKYGVTENVARSHGYSGEMRELTIDFAKQVYRKDYWDACKCDHIPELLRYPLFDAAVNSGSGQAVKWLQSSIGVKVDGGIGPITIQAANACNVLLVRQQMIGKRLRFMTDLKNWSANSRGWSKRIASLLEM